MNCTFNASSFSWSVPRAVATGSKRSRRGVNSDVRIELRVVRDYADRTLASSNRTCVSADVLGNVVTCAIHFSPMAIIPCAARTCLHRAVSRRPIIAHNRRRDRTNRWTGATGSEFRIKRDPAKLLGGAVARSTQPFGDYSFTNEYLSSQRWFRKANRILGNRPHAERGHGRLHAAC